MSGFYYPIEVMQLRDQRLDSSHSATFGPVRNNQTRNHQGWDLFAPVGTRCYAIAAGHVEWIRNIGDYGQQFGAGVVAPALEIGGAHHTLDNESF